MRNKLIDLNNHLFETIERLNNEDLSGDLLIEEVKKASAIANVAKEIINNAKTVLNAHVFANENENIVDMPKMLSGTVKLIDE